jgi:glycosyltransferase involved in cell wall biosynthesis
VITATATGGAELVTPEAGIVLSETDNVDSLAASLSVLVSDRSLRQQMGEVARTIAQQHSWSKMAQNYLDIFEELIINEKHSSHPHLSPSSRLCPLPESPATAN